MIELQGDAKTAGRRVEHPQAFGHNLLPDAVTGQNGDAQRRSRWACIHGIS